MRATTRLDVPVINRICGFLGTNEVGGAIASVANHAVRLNAIAERLTEFAAGQDEKTRAFSEVSRRARALCVALRREYLIPIARTARSVFAEDDALRRALAVPNVQSYVGTLNAARGIAGRAAEHKERLIEGGLEPDFLERLNAAIAGLESSLAEKGVKFGQRSAATAGLEAELGKGRALVRLIDSLVVPKLRSDPSRLAQWRSLARFSRVGKVEELEGDTPPTTAPQQPVAPVQGNISPPVAPATPSTPEQSEGRVA